MAPQRNVMSGWMGKTTELGLLAKAVLAAAVAMVIAGVVWHGVSIENAIRIWRNLTGRPSGALSFRFILQPSIAAAVAINEGLKDARLGRSPFFRAVLTEPLERVPRLREALNATARILLIGVCIDLAYQLIEFERFYPIESLFIAVALAFVPYCLIRGVVARIMKSALSATQRIKGHRQ